MTQSFDPEQRISLRIIEKSYALFNCTIFGLIGAVGLFLFTTGLLGNGFSQDKLSASSLIFVPITVISWWWCAFELYRAFFTCYDVVIDRAGIHLSKAFSGQTIPWLEICDSNVTHDPRSNVSLDIMLTKKIYSLASPFGSKIVHISHRAFNLLEDRLNSIEYADEAVQKHRKLAGW